MNTTCKHAVCPATLSDTRLCDCTIERMKSPAPDNAMCPVCGGDTRGTPCAYPSERKAGCLRDKVMRTELVGYDEIGSAIRKVKDEPLYTPRQIVNMIFECEDLDIITYPDKDNEISWVSAEKVLELIKK